MYCPKCGQAMIRLDYYDPEGQVSPYNIVRDKKGEAWVCASCPHDPKKDAERHVKDSA